MLSPFPTYLSMSLKGNILGLFTADSASVNSHWLYPKFFPEKYAEFIKKFGDAPEYAEPSYNPFYRSSLSPYASQSLVLLESLIATNRFDKTDFAQRLYKTFGPNTVYVNPPKVENPNVGSPVQGGWRNASIKNFVEVYGKGEANTALVGDDQADCFSKVPIIVAFYVGDPNLPRIIEDVIGVTQDCAKSLRTSIAAGKLFEAALQGKLTAASFEAFLKGEAFQDGIVDETRKELRALYDATVPINEFAIGETGRIDCHCPGAFYTALYSLRNAFRDTTDGAEIFLKVIRDTIRVSGCNSSRAGYLGALIGATYGPSVIPKHFVEKTKDMQLYMTLADKLERLKG